MLRPFTLATRKLLVPRPLTVYTCKSEVALTSYVATYDRRSNRVAEQQRSPLPSIAKRDGLLLLGQHTPLVGNTRWQSGSRGFQVPNPSEIVCNMITMLKCVDLDCMKDTPAPVFWTTFTVGGSQVVIPLLELIGGYCNVMTIFQLQLAAFTVVYLNGVKWGLAVSNNSVIPATWDTKKWVVTPIAIALLGLSLPYPLGFLTVAGAVVTTLYLDLKSCAFPPWGNAVRLFISLTTLAGLMMGLTAFLLFHNKENEKKKEEKKEKKRIDPPPPTTEDEEKNGPKPKQESEK